MPALDLAALKKQLKAGTLARVHLFVGEDVKLMESMVDAVEATVDAADRAFAVERVYGGEERGTPIDIAGAARTMPMLGDRRIVIVLRAEKLLKPKRASKAADVDESRDEAAAEDASLDFTALEEYLNDPAPTSTVVFVATEIDRTRRFTKRLIEKAHVTVFEGLRADGPGARRESHANAVGWLREEIAKAGRAIEPAGIELLADRRGADITALRGDVERLLLFTEGKATISRADVEEIASEDAPVEDDWAVINAIGEGNAARALDEVGRRLDRGDSPHGVIGQLRWWVSTRLAAADGARARPAIDALLRTDLALKSSGGDERVLVERLVVELTGKPIPRGWK